MSPRSVPLEDFHVYSRSNHEQNHKDSLRGYIDFLHRCSTQCPYRWWVWWLHVCLQLVSFNTLASVMLRLTIEGDMPPGDTIMSKDQPSKAWLLGVGRAQTIRWTTEDVQV